MRSGPLVGKVATSPLPSRGSPPLQSGGKIRSGPQVGKVATSPLPSRGSPPLQSGGQNHKWPTYGQSGYVTPAVSGIPTAAERGGGGDQQWPTSGQSGHVTPAVSGIPTAAERGGKSEVAHKWAKWLRHPCRLGDPHHFRAGGKIRSGPLVGKVATSLLPSRGSPPLQSGGENQKWPTCEQSGYVTPAVSGIPTAAERGGEIRSGPLVGKVATSPLPSRGSPPLQSGGKMRSGPLVGKVATSPLPTRGSPPLHSGGGNQKWTTCGQSGYVTPAVWGITTAAGRGKNQKWPTCGQSGYVTLAVSGTSTASERRKITSGPLVGKVAMSPLPSRESPPLQSGGGEIGSGPLVGKGATSPLPSRGSPPLQSGGGNHKWPNCGQTGYVTPAVSGIPTAAERGGGRNEKWPTYGQSGYVTPAVSGIPTAAERGAKSQVAHLWAKWLRHPCRLGDPHRCRAGGGGDQKWPTSGQSGYVTRAVSGIPTAAEREEKSEVAQSWAKWLRHPCRLGDPHRCRAGGGGGIRSGPQVGKVATSPLPSRGSPPLQSGGQNHKWPTYGQSGYVTPAVSGIPTAAERGGGGDQKWPTSGQSGYVTRAVSGIPTVAEREEKSEVAQSWAKWLRHPCRLGDPHRCRAGGEISSGPLMGKVATSPLPSRASPPLQSGGGNQKWLTSRQSGYVTPAVSGIPTTGERGEKSEVAQLWAKWLRHPCRLGDPHRYRAVGGGEREVAHKWAKWLRHPCRLRDRHRCRAGGGEFRSGPLMGKVAMSPLPSRACPPLQSGGGGGNEKWPTSGQSGYVTPAVSGIATAAERGAKPQVAHLWAKWLRHPCRLGDPHRCGAGGGKSEVAHKWAKWLRHPCRLGDPHRCRARGKIRSGQLVGKVATSPLPSRGSPLLQSGGGNRKWLTSGQSGYVTPAVSGIPTAAERGGKSEVAHLWAKWLRHPCRLRDRHRCRAGGEIRSGPQLGKVATSPLPSRGSPTLQSGGKIRSGPIVGKVATSPLPSRGSPPLQSGRGGK